MTQPNKASTVTFNEYSNKTSTIQKDEVINMIIDLHTLPVDEFINRYCLDRRPESPTGKTPLTP